MKKLFLMLLMSLGAFMSAQTGINDELLKTVNKLNVANVANDYHSLTMIEADFIKQYDKNKSWQIPYYWAILQIQKAKIKKAEGKTEHVDGYLSTGLKYLNLITKSEKNNVEVNALYGVIYYLKSKYNPSLLEKAKKYYSVSKSLEANNDRVRLLGQLLNQKLTVEEGTYQIVDNSLNPTWGVDFLGNLTKTN